MIKKYDLDCILRVPSVKCMDKILYTIIAEDDYHTMIQAFKNLKYPKKYKIIVDGKEIFRKTVWVKVIKLHDLDEEVKDKICTELEHYYDRDFSLYGPQTYNTSSGGALFDACGVLKGRNNSWLYRNYLNSITIVEKKYDDRSGERLWDASAYLDAICKNK